MATYKKIRVHVTFGTGKSSIIGSQMSLVGDETLKVRLNSAPEDGKANKELIGLLAKHFDVPKSQVSIVMGMLARDKVIQIEI